VTSPKADIADWYYIEQKDGKYFYDGNWVPLKHRKEIIKIRGKEPKEIDIKSSHHGPIFEGVSPIGMHKFHQSYMPADINGLAF